MRARAAGATPPSRGGVSRLESALAEMPDDSEPEEMLQAYTGDPLPQATAYLEVGRGYEALQLYDIAILSVRDARTGGDLSVELGLYNLYLARAVANLTASVARIPEARADLALAAYLRPGAVFPSALISVLDLVQSSDVQFAVSSLRRELAEAAPERIDAIATLLWAAGGHRPHMASNMMRFALRFRDRRIVHEFARELLGEDLQQSRSL